MSNPISLTVNGETRRTSAATIADLVRELDLAPEKVAVEHNGEIAPRSTYTQVAIADGDALEIVHFVGGGSGAIAAYQCSGNGPLVELGSVDQTGALALIAQRWPNASKNFATAEGAIAATMFGFSRSEADFLEINLAGANLITVRHEPEAQGILKRLFGSAVREYLIELKGLAELERIVIAYFKDAQSAVDILQTYPNTARR